MATTDKKSTALAKPMSAALANDLGSDFPAEVGFQSVRLPRIGFKSQDQFEGTGRNKKVSIPAGTYLAETETDELDEETGKKAWDSEELGSEIEAAVAFRRKRLSFFEDGIGYTSSTEYDSEDDVIPLFQGGKKLTEGTPAELKARYMETKNGKERSKLQEEYVLYVLLLIRGAFELRVLTVKGSSLWNWKNYARKMGPKVPLVLTKFASEFREQGSNEWNAMTFEPSRPLSEAEGIEVRDARNSIRQGIEDQKSQFAGNERHPLDSEFDKKD